MVMNCNFVLQKAILRDSAGSVTPTHMPVTQLIVTAMTEGPDNFTLFFSGLATKLILYHIFHSI